MKRPRLILVDDHALMLDGLHRLLESEYELVAAVEDGLALLDVARELKPDLVLLDISLPRMNGIDAASQLRKILPNTKIVMVTMHADPAFVVEAFRIGVSGYVLKKSAASELLVAIRHVLQGRSYISSFIAQDLMDAFLDAHPDTQRLARSLTSRQREVLQLYAEGHSAKDVANLLKISAKTVEFHRSCIMEKLGIHSIAGLTQYAIKQGIISV